MKFLITHIFRFIAEEDLIVISMDIFTASYESLNASMAFAVLYMILYPEVQTKLHQELDKYLGK
jgi:Cytochrome P450